MKENHRIRVRLGDAEFEAEGNEATVKEQFAAFLEIAGRAVSKTPDTREKTPKQTEKPPPDGAGGITPELLSRAYDFSNGVVSLRVKPTTKEATADGILLLIYGYRALANLQNVGSTPLMKGAQQSGFAVQRIDRELGSHKTVHVGSGGAKRGTTYTLNNPGKAAAERLLIEMFG